MASSCPARSRPPIVPFDDCGFPWSPRHPLVFHTLTTLGRGAPATRGLAGLVDADASLVPAGLRAGSARWAGDAPVPGRIKSLDAEAGDDRWLFFSAGKPYRGTECLAVSYGIEVTLAFDPGVLFQAGTVGWRPSDLLRHYGAIPRRWKRAHVSHLHDRAAALHDLAAWATITDPGTVRELIRLTVHHLALLQAGDLLGARRNHKEAKALLAPHTSRPPAVPLLRDGDVNWLGYFSVPRWKIDPEWGPLRWSFGPEILCDGPVPVRCAYAWQDGATGQWFPMAAPLDAQTELFGQIRMPFLEDR
jgi:hypothetical protein